MKGLIYEIQRYCVDDGPGIRTVVFFKGCPLKCPWCHNPESRDSGQEIGVYINRCINCRRCYEVCPRGAIVFKNGKRINRELCDRCGMCADVCPAKCLVRIGRYYDPDELLFEILKDLPFYQTSGGGVTFSGGEPMYQSEFLKETLRLCKKKGIHTVVETSGYAPWERVEMLMDDVDLFLYDLKIWDEGLHRQIVGGERKIVIGNFIKLTQRGILILSKAKGKNLGLRLKSRPTNKKGVIPRIPLIPGYTFNKENLKQWSKFLRELDCREVHFLPYHDMWEFKRGVIDCGKPFKQVKTVKSVKLNAAEIFETKGISVKGLKEGSHEI